MKKHNTRLAQLCFKQIKLPDPPFNICNLESSYISDKNVPDLPARVEKAISKQLLYACRYWVAHCTSAKLSQNLVSMLREFASEQFLLWMEVMSLSGNIDKGVTSLKKAQKWSLDAVELDDGIKDFLRDMSQFADEFASTIPGFTPHIYVSTLTFWPDHSPISVHYGQRRTRLITEQSTAMSLIQSAPAPHSEDWGFRALCSADGAYVVSDGFGETIHIWNALTGQLVGQPLKGHAGDIRVLAYSPDGAYIVSDSGNTIRIWNVHSGQPVGQPLGRHTDLMIFTMAYSPDGAYIVSGSDDSTIRIWDARTGEPVGQPMEEHANLVSCVEYSPDGAYIVSGSWDWTICIWDAYLGQPAGQRLRGHKGAVTSVAYSSDGALIVSGSDDGTIRIWDAYTGQPAGQPLGGGDGSVETVAYSPDGAYIAAGHYNGIIWIWDAYTGQPACELLRGSTGGVNSVAYSPDGAYIVSGSDERAIRIWSMKLALSTNDISAIDNSQPQLMESLPTTSEPRTLCNLGCRINCPHIVWTLEEFEPFGGSWIVFNGNGDDDKLIWVPPDLRGVLLAPQNTALMSTRGFLQLDLDPNMLGEHWHEYFQPRRLSNYD
ncbi:hypothetical protein FRC12_020339 [Ceratobasidium sp. 428]|nr:hypothetical protein FRC12_020339 [Ceratobasidium sp. 428]